MPKKFFWPIALVVMGGVIFLSQTDMIPQEIANLWPVVLIIVGLGGLLTADRDEWLTEEKSTPRQSAATPARKVATKKTVTKKAISSSKKSTTKKKAGTKSRR
jgi:hypothetical protein